MLCSRAIFPILNKYHYVTFTLTRHVQNGVNVSKHLTIHVEVNFQNWGHCLYKNNVHPPLSFVFLKAYCYKNMCPIWDCELASLNFLLDASPQFIKSELNLLLRLVIQENSTLRSLNNPNKGSKWGNDQLIYFSVILLVDLWAMAFASLIRAGPILLEKLNRQINPPAYPLIH